MGRRNNKRSKDQVNPQPSNDDIGEGKCSTPFVEGINNRLEALRLCSSNDEYSSISEAIAEPALENNTPPSEDVLENVKNILLEYFEEVDEDDAKKLVYAAAIDAWSADLGLVNLAVINNSEDISDGSVSDSGDHVDEEYSNSDYDEDDGDFIGEGECELCEREIKLTRHHLIPKSTWPRMKKRMWNAAPVIKSLNSLASQEELTNNDPQKMQRLQETKEGLNRKLEKILGTSSTSCLPTVITHDTVRGHLTQVCLLCRQCHSAIHRIHTEWELAIEYNTMERLLECDEVIKFGKWANKQRPGNKT